MKTLYGLLRCFTAELFLVSSLTLTIFLGFTRGFLNDSISLSNTEVSWLTAAFFILYILSQFYSDRILMAVPAKYVFMVAILFIIPSGIFCGMSSNKLILCISHALLIIGFSSFSIGFILTRPNYISKYLSRIISSMKQTTIIFCMGIFEVAASMLFTKFNYRLSFGGLSTNFLLYAILILVFFRNNDANIRNGNQKNIYSDIKALLSNTRLRGVTFYFSALSSAILFYINIITLLEASAFNLKYHSLTSTTSLGFTIGAIVAGYLSCKFINYKYFFQLFSLATLIAFSAIMFCKADSNYSFNTFYITSFLLGLACGGSTLAFQYIRNYIVNPLLKPLATSFILVFSYGFYQLIKYIFISETAIDSKFIRGFAHVYQVNNCLFNCLFHHTYFQYEQLQHFIFIVVMGCSLIITILLDGINTKSVKKCSL